MTESKVNNRKRRSENNSYILNMSVLSINNDNDTKYNSLGENNDNQTSHINNNPINNNPINNNLISNNLISNRYINDTIGGGNDNLDVISNQNPRIFNKRPRIKQSSLSNINTKHETPVKSEKNNIQELTKSITYLGNLVLNVFKNIEELKENQETILQQNQKLEDIINRQKMSIEKLQREISDLQIHALHGQLNNNSNVDYQPTDDNVNINFYN